MAAFITGGIMTVTGLTGAHIVDSNIDHLHNYCPFNYVLGVQHQIDRINNEYAEEGIRAYRSEKGSNTVTICSNTRKEINSEGTEFYFAPNNFYRIGSKAYQDQEADETKDTIYITQGEVIWPENVQPGELVRKKDLGVWNPKIIDTIDVPNIKILSR